MTTDKVHTILLKCMDDCRNPPVKENAEDYKFENQPLIDWSPAGDYLMIPSWEKFFATFQPKYFQKSTAIESLKRRLKTNSFNYKGNRIYNENFHRDRREDWGKIKYDDGKMQRQKNTEEGLSFMKQTVKNLTKENYELSSKNKLLEDKIQRMKEVGYVVSLKEQGLDMVLERNSVLVDENKHLKLEVQGLSFKVMIMQQLVDKSESELDVTQKKFNESRNDLLAQKDVTNSLLQSIKIMHSTEIQKDSDIRNKIEQSKNMNSLLEFDNSLQLSSLKFRNLNSTSKSSSLNSESGSLHNNSSPVNSHPSSNPSSIEFDAFPTIKREVIPTAEHSKRPKFSIKSDSTSLQNAHSNFNNESLNYETRFYGSISNDLPTLLPPNFLKAKDS